MGRVDLFHSRRTNFSECTFWLRDERDSIANANKWVAKTEPAGTFYAKEITPKYSQNNPIAGAMLFDRHGVTLETDDDIEDITVNSIVKYHNQLYIVENIQQELHARESQYSNDYHYRYILTLRR